MNKIILFFLLLIFLFNIVGCGKQATLNCEQACKNADYKEGECKKMPVIEKPCESIGEITLDFKCEQKTQKNILGVDYYCCCRE